MKVVGMKGRLLIAPDWGDPYEVPADKSEETWFCIRMHDEEMYYYTSKYKSSATGPHHASTVTVLQAHVEEYEF